MQHQNITLKLKILMKYNKDIFIKDQSEGDNDVLFQHINANTKHGKRFS